MKVIEDTLVRLHTDDDLIEFDNNFNEPIEIQPNAEIALHSLQLERLDTSLNITGSNDLVQFQIDAGRQLQTTIPHGIFNKDNAARKFTEITDRMNFELRSQVGATRRTKETGSQCRAFIGNKRKVNFEFRHSGPIQPSSTRDIVDNVALVSEGTSNSSMRSTSVATRATAINVCYFAFADPIGLGCSYAKVRPKVLGNAGGVNSGFFIGITSQIDKLKQGNFSIADFECGLKVQNDTAVIQKFNKGVDADLVDTVLTPSNIGGANGDQYGFQFQNHDGAVSFRMNKYSSVGGGAGSTDAIGTDQIVEIRDSNPPFTERNYFFVISFFGINTDCELEQIKITPNPFLITPSDVALQNQEVLEDTTALAAVPVPQATGRPTVYKLTLAVGVADYFGYQGDTTNPQGITTAEGIFPADNVFESAVTSDNYLVQLLNLTVNSYDSIKQGRENILSVVPFSEVHIDDVSGLVQYEPKERLFLPMKNLYPINLRRFRARVLGIDFNPITNNGLASMNVIIRNRVRHED